MKDSTPTNLLTTLSDPTVKIPRTSQGPDMFCRLRTAIQLTAILIVPFSLWSCVTNRSECAESFGRLNIEHMKVDVPQLWCWASSQSEVSKWYALPNSEACEIYDLVYSTTACKDMNDPSLICKDGEQEPETC